MKRSIVIAGHQTSISIEEPFWKGLREIAAAKDMTLSELVASIDKDRRRNNLSSHIRLYVLEYYQAKVATQSAAEQTTSSPTATVPHEPRTSVEFSVVPLETECSGTLSNVQRITAQKGCRLVE